MFFRKHFCLSHYIVCQPIYVLCLSVRVSGKYEVLFPKFSIDWPDSRNFFCRNLLILKHTYTWCGIWKHTLFEQQRYAFGFCTLYLSQNFRTYFFKEMAKIKLNKTLKFLKVIFYSAHFSVYFLFCPTLIPMHEVIQVT